MKIECNKDSARIMLSFPVDDDLMKAVGMFPPRLAGDEKEYHPYLYDLADEVADWLRAHSPESVSESRLMTKEMFEQTACIVEFPCVDQAIHFKLRWA